MHVERRHLFLPACFRRKQAGERPGLATSEFWGCGSKDWMFPVRPHRDPALFFAGLSRLCLHFSCRVECLTRTLPLSFLGLGMRFDSPLCVDVRYAWYACHGKGSLLTAGGVLVLHLSFVCLVHRIVPSWLDSHSLWFKHHFCTFAWFHVGSTNDLLGFLCVPSKSLSRCFPTSPKSLSLNPTPIPPSFRLFPCYRGGIRSWIGRWCSRCLDRSPVPRGVVCHSNQPTEARVGTRSTSIEQQGKKEKRQRRTWHVCPGGRPIPRTNET